jgi:hypothetical protein
MVRPLILGYFLTGYYSVYLLIFEEGKGLFVSYYTGHYCNMFCYFTNELTGLLLIGFYITDSCNYCGDFSIFFSGSYTFSIVIGVSTLKSRSSAMKISSSQT